MRQHAHAVVGMSERRDRHFTGDSVKLQVDQSFSHGQVVNAQRLSRRQASRGSTAGSPLSASDSPRKQQHNQHSHDRSDNATWVIAPAAAVWPRRQSANENQTKND